MNRPVLIFDGQCNFCMAWVEWLRRWDRKKRLSYLTLQDPAAAELGIPKSALMNAMHLVLSNGRVFQGADAAPELLKLVPGGWLVAWVFLVPGVPRLSRAAYGWVARRRHRLWCGSNVCRR